MKSKKKIILIIIAFIFFAGLSYGLYIWYKPMRNVKNEKGIEISAVAIFDSFEKNESRANELYLNKAIQVTGEVIEVKTNHAGQTVVYLKSNDPVFGVNCTFRENPGNITSGSVITFKGFCTGYPGDVVIDRGVLVKK